MRNIKYQLKNIRKDKMCIMTFLLPIIVGIAINLLSDFNFQNIGETAFASYKNNLSQETISWLNKNGSFKEYNNLKELNAAINEPSTQVIGVIEENGNISTIISGDELKINKTIAKTLPRLYMDKSSISSIEVNKVDPKSNNDGLKSILISITLVTAMFMGCTFNAMNIISEKEEGIYLINKILPMTSKTYILQKTALGFIGGFISTIITAFICVHLESSQIIPFIIIMVLSTYISALIGLYIGKYSEGLMVGIIYIKIIMILFLAPPIIIYMMVSQNSPIFYLSYLLPSSATFYGLMDLLSGNAQNLLSVIFVLSLHSILWSLMYIFIEKKKIK